MKGCSLLCSLVEVVAFAMMTDDQVDGMDGDLIKEKRYAEEWVGFAPSFLLIIFGGQNFPHTSSAENLDLPEVEDVLI